MTRSRMPIRPSCVGSRPVVPSAAMPMPSSVTSTRMPSASSCAMTISHPRRLAVPDRIAQPLLDDAIDRLLEIVADPILLDRDCRRRCRCRDGGFARTPPAGGSRPPARSPRIGRRRPSIGPHMALHLRRPHRGSTGHARGMSSQRSLGHELFDRRRGHVDREQQRPDLIVQVPREIGALLRLQGQQLLVQPAVLRRRRGKPLASCH